MLNQKMARLAADVLSGLREAADPVDPLMKQHLVRMVKINRGKHQTRGDTFTFTYLSNRYVGKVILSGLATAKATMKVLLSSGETKTFVFRLDAYSKTPDQDQAMREFVYADVSQTLDDIVVEDPNLVKGLVERRDLAPRTRGVSYTPNGVTVHFYEVQGEGLGPKGGLAPAAAMEQITLWLKKNKHQLTPGRHDYGHGAFTTNQLYWDRSQQAWMIKSQAEYWGG